MMYPYNISQNLSNLIQYTKSCKEYVYCKLLYPGNAYPGQLDYPD